jgi:hypothetical protein
MRSYRLNGEVYMTAPDRRAFMAATAASFATPAALGAKECPSAGMDYRYGVRSPTAFAYLCDNSVGFLRAAAVVDENLGTGGSERECARAPHATRSARNESGFAGQGRVVAAAE